MKFRGVVEKVECSSVGGFLDWIVRMRVLEIVEGTFTGDMFAFRIHSPSRSGLAVGVTCTVYAQEVATGYVVDENQWHGNPR